MKSTFDLQNPWRNPGFCFPAESYIPRGMFNALVNHLDKKEITALVGSRQVGKTFLIKKLIEHLVVVKKIEPQQVFYFNFDALNLIELFQSQKNFIDFVSYYGCPDQINYIFLDEFQRISNGGLLLKFYYDLGLRIKFIVSGSSSLEIRSQIKESLTGRKRLFELFPVSFHEFLNYRGVDIKRPLNIKIKFEVQEYEKLLEEFVQFGGYPGVICLKDEAEKILQLKEIYDSYIKKDISDFLKVENIMGFNRLVQILATQTASLCKVNELSKVVGLSRYYIDTFLQHLEDTYVIKFLRPYFKNIGKALVKTPKLYFVDSGIRNVVFNQFHPLAQRSDAGHIIENFVFSDLIKKLDPNQLWFYRTQNGAEVDFLYQRGEEIIPIEAKYTSPHKTATPKIFSTMNQSLPVKEAYILTRSYYEERQENNLKVHFVPVWSIIDLEL